MARPLKLKICGMGEPKNFARVSALEPDFLGLIFYPGSPRYVGSMDPGDFSRTGIDIPRVGVFVNATSLDILKAAKHWGFEWVQLHGEETVGACRELRSYGLTVIKVFNLSPGFDFHLLEPFVPVVDFFLFDTKTTVRGGSGQKFEWSILERYSLDTPFFLSGGIGMDELPLLDQVKNSKLYAIDVNSKFELSPGLKDLDKVEKLVRHLDSLKYEV